MPYAVKEASQLQNFQKYSIQKNDSLVTDTENFMFIRYSELFIAVEYKDVDIR